MRMMASECNNQAAAPTPESAELTKTRPTSTLKAVRSSPASEWKESPDTGCAKDVAVPGTAAMTCEEPEEGPPAQDGAGAISLEEAISGASSVVALASFTCPGTSVLTRAAAGKGKQKAKDIPEKGDAGLQCTAGVGKAAVVNGKTSTAAEMAQRGSGKRPRDGQSHKRARQDDGAVDEDKPEAVSPDIEKLWAMSAKLLGPLRKQDENLLRVIVQTYLESWGVPAAAAREVAEKYRGSWLHPTMGLKELTAAMDELMPLEMKMPPIVALGRFYRDVWMEEDFVSALEEENAEGPQPLPGAGAAAAAAATGAAATGAVPSSAACPEGERRSLRACGRRTSGFCMSGGGGNGSGGGGGGRKGGGVVFPCALGGRHPATDWTQVVRGHDETRHRSHLADARRRLGLQPGVGFGACESDVWELEMEKPADTDANGNVDTNAHIDPDVGVERDNKEGGAGEGEEKQKCPKEQLRVDGSSRPRRFPDRASRDISGAPSCPTPQAPTPEAPPPGLAGPNAKPQVQAKQQQEQQQQQQQQQEQSGGEPPKPTDSSISTSTQLRPVWKGGPANSICHPTKPPREFASLPTRAKLARAFARSAAASNASPSAIAAAVSAAHACAGIVSPAPVSDSEGKTGAAEAVAGAAAAVEDAVVDYGGGGGGKRSSGRLRGLARTTESERDRHEREEQAFQDGGYDGKGEDYDEVCREIEYSWRAMKNAELHVTHRCVELIGLSLQERLVFQGVWDRATDAQDLLSSSLALSELGKPKDRKGKPPPQVGLPDDFPYHDPSEAPVLRARLQQNEALKEAQWVPEDMAGFPPREVEAEKARRDKRKKEATDVAERAERAWVSQRLAAGRSGQRGRGRGLPIPGGVAHPFLVNREGADFLYSLGLGQEVEAKDEHGVWCRGKVVAARGDGGWVPENGDTNVLRAVKVSFRGWGGAMDTWLPVDSGMLAKPGTHLATRSSSSLTPSSGKRQRSHAAETGVSSGPSSTEACAIGFSPALTSAAPPHPIGTDAPRAAMKRTRIIAPNEQEACVGSNAEVSVDVQPEPNTVTGLSSEACSSHPNSGDGVDGGVGVSISGAHSAELGAAGERPKLPPGGFDGDGLGAISSRLRLASGDGGHVANGQMWCGDARESSDGQHGERSDHVIGGIQAQERRSGSGDPGDDVGERAAEVNASEPASDPPTPNHVLRTRFTRGRATVIVHPHHGRITLHAQGNARNASSDTLPPAADSPTHGSSSCVSNGGHHAPAGPSMSSPDRRSPRLTGDVGVPRPSGGATGSINSNYQRWANCGVVKWKDSKDGKSAEGVGLGVGVGASESRSGGSESTVVPEPSGQASGTESVAAAVAAVAAAAAGGPNDSSVLLLSAASVASDSTVLPSLASNDNGTLPPGECSSMMSSAEFEFGASLAANTAAAAAATPAATATVTATPRKPRGMITLLSRPHQGSGGAPDAVAQVMGGIEVQSTDYDEDEGEGVVDVGEPGSAGYIPNGAEHGSVPPHSLHPSAGGAFCVNGVINASAAVAAVAAEAALATATGASSSDVGPGFVANARASSSTGLKLVLRRG